MERETCHGSKRDIDFRFPKQSRAASIRADEVGKPCEGLLTMTEEQRKILFGQTVRG
jgi:hypothetical protein